MKVQRKITGAVNLFLTAAALFFSVSSVADIRDAELCPRNFNVKIKEFTLSDSAGGKIEIQIYSNEKIIFSAEEQVQPEKKGAFSVNKEFNFAYTPGDSLKVQNFRKGRLFNKTLLSRTSSSADAVNEIFSSSLENNGNAISFETFYPQGLYRIKIDKSFMADKDFIAAGGVPETNKYEKVGKLILDTGDGTKQYLKEKISDKVQQRIRIRGNGKIILDSISLRKLSGQSADWDLVFEIDWKPGDNIEVLFSDYDFLTSDDIIFSKSSNTETSISIFNGVLRGGSENKSFISFRILSVKSAE